MKRKIRFLDSGNPQSFLRHDSYKQMRGTSGNTELGGAENLNLHEGCGIAPNELTEFDNNLVGVRNVSKEMKFRMF